MKALKILFVLLLFSVVAPAFAVERDEDMTASGVLVAVDDGEILLQFDLPPADTQMLRRIAINGTPYKIGTVGWVNGHFLVRYLLGDELIEKASAYLNKSVIVQLSREEMRPVIAMELKGSK